MTNYEVKLKSAQAEAQARANATGTTHWVQNYMNRGLVITPKRPRFDQSEEPAERIRTGTEVRHS